jgi:hypothetical protein
MSVDDPNNIVYLNVGGMRYTTFLGTLRRHPESILAGMFRHPISLPRDSRDQNSAFFLDRNGAVFGVILDYLRGGTLLIPRDATQYCALRREVAFFGLPISAQLPPIQPVLWEAAPKRFKHARIVVDDIEKIIEWEEGPFPQDLYTKTVDEIVKFFGARGYQIASEYASRGTHGLTSVWMAKEEVFPGADVPVELMDRVPGSEGPASVRAFLSTAH